MVPLASGLKEGDKPPYLVGPDMDAFAALDSG